MPKLFLILGNSRKPISSFTNKQVNPITTLISATSISEEITISAIVASSDFSETIEEKKKLRNAA
jgi:hypothetical protein